MWSWLFPRRSHKNATELFEKHKSDIVKKLAHLSKKRTIEINPTDHLYQDLNLDSLDVTELIVWLERRFHVNITFEGLETVEDIFRAAQGKQRIEPLEKEVKKMQEKWRGNGERTPVDTSALEQTLFETFLRTCDRMKSESACAYMGSVMSYTRLKSLTLGFAEEFKGLCGEKVGVLAPSSPEFNAIVLALMLAKKIPTILNWSLGIRHLEEVSELAKLEVIISAERFLSSARLLLPPSVEKKIISIEQIKAGLTFKKRQKILSLSRRHTDELISYFGLHKKSGDDPAVLLFTSGTEKEPKGVVLTHHNLLNNQKAALDRVELNAQDVLMGMLPSFHVFGLSLTNLAPLLAGVRVVCYPNPLDCAAILEQIEKWAVSVLCATPTFLKALLSVANPEQLKTVRLFVVGAERLPQALIDHINTHFPNSQIIEGYGLTECSPILTLNHLYKQHKGVGEPLPGVELCLIHPDTKKPLLGDQRSSGEGVVCAHGPNVFAGYLNESREETNEPFLTFSGKKWFVTGDLGYFDEEGNLFLTGRLSRSIKIGAERINLNAIEYALQQECAKQDVYSGLQCAVVYRGRDNEESHLVLFSTQSIALDEVNHLLRQAGLSNLMRIKEVKVIEKIPILANGKVDYRNQLFKGLS